VRLDPATCRDEDWGRDACTYHKAGERDFPQEKTEDPGGWAEPGVAWSLHPLSTVCPAR